MSQPDLEAEVVQSLSQVAPELEPQALDHARPFRDQLDLDSIDFLRFVQDLSKRSGVEIAERDYPQLLTVQSCAKFLAAHAPH